MARRIFRVHFETRDGPHNSWSPNSFTRDVYVPRGGAEEAIKKAKQLERRSAPEQVCRAYGVTLIAEET